MPFHARTQRYAHITAHRRCGKTVACVRDTEKRALQCDHPYPKYAYIAPLLKQAKRNVWNYIKEGYYPLRQYGAKLHETELHVTYPNGARFQVFGANDPDNLRGDYLDGAIVDEFAFMNPDILTDIIMPMLADRGGWLVLIGSPNGRNQFYNMRRYALEHQDEWFTTLLKASETGALAKSELARMRAMMTEARYLREFECSFDVVGSKQLISAQDIEMALAREPRTSGLRAIGADPARRGEDHFAIVGRIGSLIRAKRYSGLESIQGAAMIYEMMQEVRPAGVFIDEVGIGAGVVDQLRVMPYFGQVGIYGVNYSHKARDDQRFRDLKAECWWLLREWIRRFASLKGDVPAQLIEDLMTPEYDFNLKGQVVIESKEEIKDRGLPSPDYGDALSNTFAVPLMAEEEAPLGYMQRKLIAQTELATEPDDPFASLNDMLHPE